MDLEFDLGFVNLNWHGKDVETANAAVIASSIPNSKKREHD